LPAAVNDLLVDPRFVAVLRRSGLDSLDAVFAYSEGQLLDKPTLDPWRKRIRFVLSDGESESTYFLKRFDHPPSGARRAIRRSGSGARSLAGNEWTWIARLAGEGIPCLQAAAFGEETRRGREVRSAILTVQVPGLSLESWCKQWSAADRATIRTVISAAARLVAKLHGAGFIHRDLYLSHLFFDPRRSVDEALCLIDLQRVVRPRWRLRRWVIKDLAALNYSAPASLVSRADRVRWLRVYLGGKRLGAAGKRLAYRVIGKTQSIAAGEPRERR